MALYTKTTVTDENKAALHDALSITGADISISYLPAAGMAPLIPHTKGFEEIFTVLSGRGFIIVDNREKVELSVGDWIRIEPRAIRQFCASRYSDVKYLRIKVKESSLRQKDAE